MLKEHRVKETFINVDLVLSCSVDHAHVRLVRAGQIEIPYEVRVGPLVGVLSKGDSCVITHFKGVKAAAPHFPWDLKDVSIDNERVLIGLCLHVCFKLEDCQLQVPDTFGGLHKVLAGKVTVRQGGARLTFLLIFVFRRTLFKSVMTFTYGVVLATMSSLSSDSCPYSSPPSFITFLSSFLFLCRSIVSVRLRFTWRSSNF